ncbi:MAG: methylmalonyl-CoA mutase family protein [Sandaracinaceae bacterium]
MSNVEPATAFPSVSFAEWRERAEVGGPLRNVPLLEGPTVEVLHTERPDEARGRPGASPFVRGATPHPGATLLFELRGGDTVLARAKSAVDAGAEAVRIGPEGCAALNEESLASLAETVGSAELTLAPGLDALAFALRAPGSVRVADDPLADLARTGRLHCAPVSALARTAGRAAQTEGRPLEIDTRPYHEAGAGPATEIAVAASSGLTLLRALVDVDHPLADGPRKMAFTFALDPDVFLGMATLRAARWVWSKVLRALGIDGPEQGMRIHASSSLRSTSRLEPMNNALRGTTSAFAAFAGGANEISVLPFDGVTGAPSEAGDRLALTTLHMLRWESHLGRVCDPGGGSFHLESLTSALARQAWAELQEIEHQGGVLRGLLDGSLKERISETAAKRAYAAATRKRAIVGASRYASPEAPVSSATWVERGEEQESEPASERSLAALREMKEASLAELRVALRGVDAPSLEPLAPLRTAAPFESLRDLSLGDLSLGDVAEPKLALILAVGPAAKTRARVDFARDALGVAGLSVEVQAAEDAEAARTALEGLAAACVCLATPNEEIDALVPVLLAQLTVPLIVAAAPRELEGVAAYLHRKMHAIEVLTALNAALDAAEEASS